MSCQTCKSNAMASVDAKCGDLIVISYADGSSDDKPVHPIGAGDYIRFTWCTCCGQIQGDFPK